MHRRSALSPHLASVRRLGEDVLSIVTALAVLLAGIARTEVSPRTQAVAGDSEANKELVRRYFAIVGQGDLRGLSEIVSADVVVRTAPPCAGTALQRLTPTLARARAGLSDFAVHIDDLFAEGDLVMARTTISGVQCGDVVGAAPTGKKIVIPVIDVWRVTDGKLAEVWHFADIPGFMQPGAIPAFGDGQAPSVAIGVAMPDAIERIGSVSRHSRTVAVRSG